MLKIYICKIVAECFLQMCEASLVFTEKLGSPLLLVHDLRFHWQEGYLHLKQTKT